ncbi:hypothetical protein Ddye_002837 [Dipteronia dyeriana]|uniref:Alpha/beta hydrolase fold-3 domain-containing protein n=1 Tax=Dipteronia dyeriana TaxID=168575 RepID=A0AAD9XRU6_9ROSI|nr:hypothetical protein Ddye_002837 [Dipteronia dyeriana]
MRFFLCLELICLQQRTREFNYLSESVTSPWMLNLKQLIQTNKMASVQLPWKLRLIYTACKLIVNLSRRRDDTINRRLQSLTDPKTSPSKTPRNGVVSSDTVINSSKDLWFRCYTPTTTTTSAAAAHGGDDGRSLPIIIYIHGGGFAIYSASSTAYDSWCRRLSGELNAVVVSINYRLAPEHRCPTQYEDSFDTLKFLDENLDKLPANVNPKLCFIAGDSAGGNLVHHVAVKASEYEFSSLKLIGLISIQPFFGGEERTESEIRNSGGLLLSLEDTDWYWKMFLPDGSDRDHPAVNVFGPKSSVDISRVKYPSTLILIGGLDLLYDWQRKYYDELKKAGKEADLVEDPNAFHGSHMFEELPGSALFIQGIRDFMGKQMNKENY